MPEYQAWLSGLINILPGGACQRCLAHCRKATRCAWPPPANTNERDDEAVTDDDVVLIFVTEGFPIYTESHHNGLGTIRHQVATLLFMQAN